VPTVTPSPPPAKTPLVIGSKGIKVRSPPNPLVDPAANEPIDGIINYFLLIKIGYLSSKFLSKLTKFSIIICCILNLL
jgi:hypothetical protein